MLRFCGGLCSTEVVFKTNNVVFAEIITSLDFDKNQISIAGVFDPMRRTDGNIDRFAGSDQHIATVECDFGSSFNDKPMLRALRVFLVAQSFPRQHFDTLHFERWCFFEHGVTAPWSPIE